MSITEDIWKVLRNDLAIRKDLERGLINHRALARYVLKNYKIKASLEAGISAIRRFKTESRYLETEKELLGIFRGSVISTKNDITCLTLAPGAKKKLPGLIEKTAGSALRMMEGSRSIKVFLEQSRLKDFEKFFTRSETVKTERDLSELSVILDERIKETKGVLARIAEEISLHDINITEMIICPPEFLIYVRQEDIIKTYESLLKLREKGI